MSDFLFKKHGLILSSLVLGAFSSTAFENVNFSNQHMKAGNLIVDFSSNDNNVLSGSAILTRSLGVANFSKELAMPMQLTYISERTNSGLFGFNWQVSQLESSMTQDGKTLKWQTPWGGELVFQERSKKLDDPDKIFSDFMHKEFSGKGYVCAYSNYLAAGSNGRYQVVGRKELKGWTFNFVNYKIKAITAPNGEQVVYNYNREKQLVSVSQRGTNFVELSYNKNDNTVSTLRVNDIAYNFDYSSMNHITVRKNVTNSKDFKYKKMEFSAPTLVKIKIANVADEVFGYDNMGLLQTATRGKNNYELKLDHSVGKKFAELKSDSNFKYNFKQNKSIEASITDNNDATQKYSYDKKLGILKITDANKQTVQYLYHRRFDVPYNGKLRKIVGPRGRDLASYSYYSENGKVKSVSNLLGIVTSYKYDKNNRVNAVYRNAGSEKPAKVSSLSYDRRGNVIGVNKHDAKGNVIVQWH